MVDRVEKAALVVDGSGVFKGAQQAAQGIDQIAQAGKKFDATQVEIERATKRVESSLRSQERFIESVTRRYDPAAAAAARYAKEEARLQGIVAAGNKNSAAAAQALNVLRKSQSEAANGQVELSGKTKLSAFQMQQLSFQINDVVSGLLMGQKPTQILFQQGGQISQVFGGVGKTLGMIFSPTGLMVGGVVAAAVAMGALVARAASLEGQIRSLNTAATAYNNTAFSAEYLQSQANNTARLGFSRSDSLAATQSLIGYRSLSASTVRGIQGTAGNYAVATDQEIGAAMSKLGDAFAKGYDGVVALNTQYGFLSRAQAEQVRVLYESGRGAEAAQIALEALNKQVTKASDIARDKAITSFKELGNAITNAFDAIAKSPGIQAILKAAKSGAEGVTGYLNRTPYDKALADYNAAQRRVDELRARGGDARYTNQLTGAQAELNRAQAALRAAAEAQRAEAERNASATGEQDEAARKRVNEADITAAKALTASYRRQIEMANALTDVQRDRWEVEQQAIQRYSGEGTASQRAAFVGGELSLREARRNNVFDREIYNAPRNLGYQQDIASAALQGPAARQAAQDTVDVRRRLADEGRPTSGARYNALLDAANQNRAATNAAATNASIYSQQQDIALTQQKIGLIGKSTSAQSEALAVYQATVAMQERYGENLPAEATAYINNARELAKVNAELQKQQASLDEITGFFDQTFDRIGSGLTEAAMEGKSALESLKNVGSAVASQLYQEFFKLIALNPLKNWLFGTGAPDITSVGGVIGSIFGGLFADGGKISGPGGPRSDSILAAVSNGEYIVNADATSKYLPLLEAINDNRIKAFADGGMVSTVPAPKIASVAAGGSSSTVFSPSITITMTGSGGSTGQADMEKMGQMITGQLDVWFNDRMRREQSPGGTLYGRLSA